MSLIISNISSRVERETIRASNGDFATVIGTKQVISIELISHGGFPFPSFEHTLEDWFVEKLVPVLDLETVERLMAACVARRLNL